MVGLVWSNAVGSSKPSLIGGSRTLCSRFSFFLFFITVTFDQTIKYGIHICGQSSLSNHDRGQNFCIRGWKFILHSAVDFPTGATLQACCYTIAISIANFQMNFILQFRPLQQWICHTTSMESNHPHSKLEKDVQLNVFSTKCNFPWKLNLDLFGSRVKGQW